MINSADEMIALVDSQVKTIADPIVRSTLQSLLIPPIKQQRDWFYGETGQTFPCWLVMEHKNSNIGIAYSDLGFGPSLPWGLVFLSDNFIGVDSSWFPTLERAFYDTYAAADLKIWNLVKKVKGEILEVIENDLTMAEAYEKRDNLKLDPSIYAVEHRIPPSK